MHPVQAEQTPYVTELLKNRKGPVIAATDYMRLYADQIRPFVEAPFITLGTDGYGRSDTRERLRHFFEVDAKFIVMAVLHALLKQGDITKNTLTDAMKKYGVDADKCDPITQ
jgi:pyruvate dehydrogenase E1 component